jgi:hypothetical protein
MLSKISCLDQLFFKVPRVAASSRNVICACQSALRCCSLMDACSHAATGMSDSEAGVLRAERAPSSCPVGVVVVASPADAIWTRHNRPHRSVDASGCPALLLYQPPPARHRRVRSVRMCKIYVIDCFNAHSYQRECESVISVPSRMCTSILVVFLLLLLKNLFFCLLLLPLPPFARMH